MSVAGDAVRREAGRQETELGKLLERSAGWDGRTGELHAARGTLLRDEPYTTEIPAGARAWRILYTTTRDDDTPAVASAIALVSESAPSGRRPVVAWAHGTTGYAPKCAPSLVARGLDAGAIPALDRIVANGWVLVATDYVGLGTESPHPYLIGDPEGRSVLDAVLAARQLDGVELQDRTVVCHRRRRPLPGDRAARAVRGCQGPAGGQDHGRVRAVRLQRRVSRRTVRRRLPASPGPEPWFAKSPADGPLGKRLRENVPLKPIAAPLMMGQGLADPLVRPDVQQRYVDRMCDAGQRLEYRTYTGYDHVGVVTEPRSPLIPDLIR